MKWDVTRHNSHDLSSFKTTIDSFFNDFLSSSPLSLYESDWKPLLDVTDDGKIYKVTADLPGLTEKDVTVNIEKGILSIEGEKSESSENKENNYLVSEREFGSFKRSVRLPEDIRQDKITAEFKNGVLTVSIPKSEQTEPKKIDIKVN
jgi:HSP20 family protein